MNSRTISRAASRAKRLEHAPHTKASHTGLASAMRAEKRNGRKSMLTIGKYAAGVVLAAVAWEAAIAAFSWLMRAIGGAS